MTNSVREAAVVDDIREARRERDQVAARLKVLDGRIARVEASCTHDFTPVEQTREPHVIYEPDYTNPIGRGSDLWYGERAVETTRPVWTRTCRLCGKVERTTEQRDVTTTAKVPAFGR